MELTQEQKALLESDEMKAYIQKQVQAVTEQTRQKYEQELQDKEKQLHQQRLSVMSKEERVKAELELKQQEIERLEQQFKQSQLDSFVNKTLQQFGLSVDSKKFIMGSDELEITQKARELSRLVSSQIQHQQRSIPAQAQNMRNPFAEAAFNMTEQGKLIRDNPQLAKQLATQANFDLSVYGL